VIQQSLEISCIGNPSNFDDDVNFCANLQQRVLGAFTVRKFSFLLNLGSKDQVREGTNGKLFKNIFVNSSKSSLKPIFHIFLPHHTEQPHPILRCNLHSNLPSIQLGRLPVITLNIMTDFLSTPFHLHIFRPWGVHELSHPGSLTPPNAHQNLIFQKPLELKILSSKWIP
jgi:hypothetical protein